MKRRRKFPKRYAIYLVAVLYLFCDLVWLNGPISRRVTYHKNAKQRVRQAVKEGRWVATVNTHPITREQLDLSTAIYLYRRGDKPEELSESSLRITRRAVMQELINDTLVTQYAKAEKFAPPAEAVDKALTQFKNQFENEQDQQRRMQAQKLSQEELRQRITQHVTDQLWLEKRIRPAVGVDEAAALAWYEKNHNNPEAQGFTVPDIIRARQIFISTVEEDGEDRKKLIDDIARQLKEGERDFAELAAEYSEDERSKTVGGDLGWFSARRMPADFAEQVFKLEVAEVSEPFRSKLGWHLVEVTDKKEARELSFEELKPEIIAWLENQRRAEVLQIFMLKLRKASNIIIYPENM
ncbi:MAG: peptidylprolyl isomerase [Verrucomicrobiales bacterium]|nr:peptidylprolyl isomerase [Verrucomicrobiales bacterium]